MVLNLRKIQYHPFEPVFADLALLLDAAKTGICSADIHEPIKTKNPTAYWLWDFNLSGGFNSDIFLLPFENIYVLQRTAKFTYRPFF